jgi:ATP-dependent Zn protease
MGGPINEHASALAQEWRRLTRYATFVALLTAPAFFLILFDTNHFGVIWALVITAIAVVMFRGLVEVVARKVIPSPSLYGAEATLKQEDIVARRRFWYWRGKFRRLPIYIVIVLALLGIAQLFLWLGGVSAPFFNPLSGIRQIFPPAELPQLGLVFLQLPMLFFINFAIFFGPFLFFAVRQIRGYEPGDASWGVKIDDVRGQAEAKEEITRVITLWQSGEEFEKAGGKRERGLLFLGAPGTGKTMISKAIATNFNCPFVTIPGSGFAGMFIGMDAITVQFLAHKARKLAKKWGGQCIVFIDEIDAVGARRQSLGSSMTAEEPTSISDLCFFGPNGSITASGDLIIESHAWRERLFAAREEPVRSGYAQFVERSTDRIRRYYPGFGMGGMGGGMALNQLLVVMDGIDEPPMVRKFVTNRVNTFLDAMFVVPSKLGALKLRLAPPRPRQEQIYFIGACNVPITVLDPALTRPGRMGRHIWFRTPTKDDRLDILDLYINKVDHEPGLDTPRRRDELARITNGYSPSMIEQCCSMALTIAHSEGRRRFGWGDIVEAMTTVETGTAQNIEYVDDETRAVAIHEAGHAAAGHVYMEKDVLSTRLSIRKRGGSLGHYQGMEKEERFNKFRSNMMGGLIMTLGAMAAEQVFYGENSRGVAGDVYSATATAAAMVGQWAMGPDPVTLKKLEIDADAEEVLKRLERIGTTIMNRAAGQGMFNENPIGAVLGDRDKRRNAAQILGQAYVTAYALMAVNRAPLDRIADVLVERREMHGDEVVDLLNSVGLTRPEIDLMDTTTWPTV